MIKKLSVVLGFAVLLLANLAFAQGAATVTSVTGTAQVQTGGETPRPLHVGDQLLQGDTVSTAAGSSLVMKFDDGEVTALTQNSRMTITAYQYESTSRTGNMLLSLVTGGMRAITGLLGRSQPERVAYRAATATIGIRGTDVTIVSDGATAEVTVTDGAVTLTVGGTTITLTKGERAYVFNGAISRTPPSGWTGNAHSYDFPALNNLTAELMRTQETFTLQNAAASSGTITPGTVPGGGAGGGGGSASLF